MYYTKEGKIILNSNGQVINCEDCPCNEKDVQLFVDMIEVKDDFDIVTNNDSDYGNLQYFRTGASVSQYQNLVMSQKTKLDNNYTLDDSLHYTIKVQNSSININAVKDDTRVVNFLSGENENNYVPHVINSNNSTFSINIPLEESILQTRYVYDNNENYIETSATILNEVTEDYLNNYLSLYNQRQDISALLPDPAVSASGFKVDNIYAYDYYDFNTLTSDLSVTINGASKNIFITQESDRIYSFYKEKVDVTDLISSKIFNIDDNYYFYIYGNTLDEDNRIDISDIFNDESNYFECFIDNYTRQIHRTSQGQFYYFTVVDVCDDINPYLICIPDEENSSDIQYYYYKNSFNYRCYLDKGNDHYITATVNNQTVRTYYSDYQNNWVYYPSLSAQAITLNELVTDANNNKLECVVFRWSYISDPRQESTSVKYDTTCSLFYADISCYHHTATAPGFHTKLISKPNNSISDDVYHQNANIYVYNYNGSDSSHKWCFYYTDPEYKQDNEGLDDEITNPLSTVLYHEGSIYGLGEGGQEVTGNIVGNDLNFEVRYYFKNNEIIFYDTNNNRTYHDSNIYYNSITNTYYYITEPSLATIPLNTLKGSSASANYYGKPLKYDTTKETFYFELTGNVLTNTNNNSISVYPNTNPTTNDWYQKLAPITVGAAKEYYATRIISGISDGKLWFKEHYNYLDEQEEPLKYYCTNYCGTPQTIDGTDYIYFLSGVDNDHYNVFNTLSAPVYYEQQDNKFYYYNGIAEMEAPQSSIVTGLVTNKIYLLKESTIFGLSSVYDLQHGGYVNYPLEMTYNNDDYIQRPFYTLKVFQTNYSDYDLVLTDDDFDGFPLYNTSNLNLLISNSTTLDSLYTYYHGLQEKVYYDNALSAFYILPYNNNKNHFVILSGTSIHRSYPYCYKMKTNYKYDLVTSYDSDTRLKNLNGNNGTIELRLVEENGTLCSLLKSERVFYYLDENQNKINKTSELSDKIYYDTQRQKWYCAYCYNPYGNNENYDIDMWDVTDQFISQENSFSIKLHAEDDSSVEVYQKPQKYVYYTNLQQERVEGSLGLNNVVTFNNINYQMNYDEDENHNVIGYYVEINNIRYDITIMEGRSFYYKIDITDVIQDPTKHFQYVDYDYVLRQIYIEDYKLGFEVLTGWFVNTPNWISKLEHENNSSVWKFTYNTPEKRYIKSLTGTEVDTPPPFFYWKNYYSGYREAVCNIFSSYYFLYDNYEDYNPTVGQIYLIQDRYYDMLYGYPINHHQNFFNNDNNNSEFCNSFNWETKQKLQKDFSVDRYKSLHPLLYYQIAGIEERLVDRDQLSETKTIQDENNTYYSNAYMDYSNYFYNNDGYVMLASKIKGDNQSQNKAVRISINTSNYYIMNLDDSLLTSDFDDVLGLSCEILTGINFFGSTNDINLCCYRGKQTGILNLNTWYNFGATFKNVDKVVSGYPELLSTNMYDIYDGTNPIEWDKVTFGQLKHCLNCKRRYWDQRMDVGIYMITIIKPLALVTDSNDMNDDMSAFLDNKVEDILSSNY